MDPSDSHSQEPEPEPEPERVKKNGVVLVILRCLFGVLLPFFFLSSIPFLFGLLVFSVADFSIPNPISLPSQCKIVSTGVDIRSSKICELGLLNYKAKDVFHHFERSKFRCRYDYYWASVFKVEYKDHFSGQTQVAFAEAPNEALPLHCRPNFGAAWLTQYKFKVNETYNCWYTSGIAKVHLNQDNLFGCHADEQSSLEKVRQYCTMAMEMVKSWFSGKGMTLYWRWETMAGVVAGFLTSLLSLAFIRFLQLLLSTLYHFFVTWIFPKRFNAVLIARTCCLLAYISSVTWLVIHYGRRLGLVDIFRFPKS